MKRSIRLTALSAFFIVSPVLTFAQSAGSPAPNGALPENNPGNQAVVTRAVQSGKGNSLSRYYGKTVPANAYRTQTAEEQAGVLANPPAQSTTGFTNEVVALRNPGDAAFRK